MSLNNLIVNYVESGNATNEAGLFSRFQLIQITRKQLQTLENKLDKYLSTGVKNKANFKACIRKKQLEILRLKSVLKYIDVVKV